MKNEEIKQEQDKEFSCSVVVSLENILNFYGTKKEIESKLKFIRDSLFEVEDEKFSRKQPVILVAQDDVSDVRIFEIGDYEHNID